MKRYEKISKEEIINSIPFLGRNCAKCLVNKEFCRGVHGEKSCGEVLEKWLTQEIKTAPRIKTINTKDDLILAKRQFEEFCTETDCSECPYWDEKHHYLSCNTCFINFLGEEVEI